jgi:lysozyme family protein
MSTDPRFESCLPIILKEEGGNDDDPHDHGGRTSRGITQREYLPWRVKHGLPDRDVFEASDQEIHDIYYEEYWLPHGPKLHPGADLVYFNFAVNAGAGEAHKLLMRSIGPDDVDNDATTINRMCNAGEVFYRGLAQFPRYGNDWTHRTERIRAAALKMQQESPVGYDPKSGQVPHTAPVVPTEPSTPIIQQTEGHTMVDVTTLIKELNIGLDLAEKWDPFLASLGILPPPVNAVVVAALKGIRTVEAQLGLPTSSSGFAPAAAAQVEAHLTPGAPNSPALNG